MVNINNVGTYPGTSARQQSRSAGGLKVQTDISTDGTKGNFFYCFVCVCMLFCGLLRSCSWADAPGYVPTLSGQSSEYQQCRDVPRYVRSSANPLCRWIEGTDGHKHRRNKRGIISTVSSVFVCGLLRPCSWADAPGYVPTTSGQSGEYQQCRDVPRYVRSQANPPSRWIKGTDGHKHRRNKRGKTSVTSVFVCSSVCCCAPVLGRTHRGTSLQCQGNVVNINNVGTYPGTSARQQIRFVGGLKVQTDRSTDVTKGEKFLFRLCLYVHIKEAPG